MGFNVPDDVQGHRQLNEFGVGSGVSAGYADLS